MEKDRNSNIELLRILSIMMITIHHIAYHALAIYGSDPSTLNTFNMFLINSFNLFGKTGVDIFVLITGYFMYKSNFTARKFFKIWGQVLFYSVIGFSVYKLFFNPDYVLSIKDFFIKIIFPGSYWFATDYIVLMLFTPFINLLIKNLSKFQHLSLILLLTLIYSITCNFYPFIGYDAVVWFINLYLIGSWISKYYRKGSHKAVISFGIFTSVYLISIIINQKLGYINNPLALENGPLTLIMSICIFIDFLYVPTFKSKFINMLGSITFGVYLIQDHELCRVFFWNSVLKVSAHAASYHLWMWVIVYVPIAFIMCGIVDLIRKNTIEKIYLFIIDYIGKKIKPRYNSICNRIKQKDISI